MRRTRFLSFIAGVAMAGLAFTPIASADGTEVLGAPSIAIADGSGVVANGTGMVVQPGVVNLDVPAAASVAQVLLYWNGFHSGAAVGADNTISVDGIPVLGTLIGGPTLFFPNNYSSTYRADITGLGLVSPGLDNVTLSGMTFDKVNNGAGVMVIYNDGTEADIGLVDGNDLAFTGFAAPLNTTVAKTFNFAPEPAARTADLSMFFSSVEGQDLPGARPSVIRITSGGVVTEIANVLVSGDGEEWDTLNIAVNVPANAGSVTVQAFSEDTQATGNLPASFAWNAAALSIGVTPPDGGGQGCTPGYWKQPHHLDSWVGYTPNQIYGTVFGVTPAFGSITLLSALGLNGGQDKALARHAVAALLNAANPNVSYDLTTAQIIALVQGAYASGNYNGAKAILETANESGCPLN